MLAFRPARSRGRLCKQFFGGKTVARWQSVWTSGLDLVASYKQARLSGALPDALQATELRRVGLEPHPLTSPCPASRSLAVAATLSRPTWISCGSWQGFSWLQNRLPTLEALTAYTLQRVFHHSPPSHLAKPAGEPQARQHFLVVCKASLHFCTVLPLPPRRQS